MTPHEDQPSIEETVSAGLWRGLLWASPFAVVFWGVCLWWAWPRLVIVARWLIL